MKRIIPLVLAVAVLLCGCGEISRFVSGLSPVYTEQDSVSEFNIYPQNEKFQTIGKFDRAEYNNLTDAQKSVYIALDNAVYNMKIGYIKVGAVTEDDINIVYNALRNDRPEYFWLPFNYSFRKRGQNYEVLFADSVGDWLYTAQKRAEIEQQISEKLLQFIETCDKSDSQFERELKAHDYLASSLTYNHQAVGKYNAYRSAWDITGAFSDGKVVCEGYSKAMQVMCFALGINSTVITGVTDEPHMWNLVNIDGDWYHLDLTANDSADKGYRLFFNVTTKSVLLDRTINPIYSSTALQSSGYNTFLPDCNEVEYNYHIVNSAYIADKSQVQSTVVSQICAAVREGRHSVEFAVSSDMGFISGKQDAAEFFNLKKCISTANSELPRSKRIKKYSYGGIAGASGFMVSW